MFRVETQESYRFEDLTTIQHGWDFTVAQIGPSTDISHTSLYQTPHVGYNKFRYGTPYDQRLHAKPGVLSFGLLNIDNPNTWAYDQLIPNNALTVFPRDDDLKAASPSGFCGNGIHLSEVFMTILAEQIYCLPLNLLIPAAGIYLPNIVKIESLRHELLKWQQLTTYGADTRPEIISRREENLALAVIDALCDARSIEKDDLKKSDHSVSRALDIIHSSKLENISALELCKHAGCSQRSLEKGFLKKFGITPKKYIKCLRLAQVHEGLRNFDAQGCESIIELAGNHGFWHMGQFAADYRRIYGELPSTTLSHR
jgi:AraC-like DNA-binding protein